jgi:cellulose synthase/poly-beta-1,6-N-acetylglucosamine synthase-like glycosyltransferase
MMGGGLGIAGCSGLFPLCAAALYQAQGVCSARTRKKLGSATVERASMAAQWSSAPKLRLVIGVPARDEAEHLGATLHSINEAVEHLTRSVAGVIVDVIVADDGSTDTTTDVARQSGATVIREESARGKWAMLRRLSTMSHAAAWIAFVDAGAIWPRDILNTWYAVALDERVMGVAPGYRRRHAGVGERISWALERRLKSVENFAGGPISVHGATVFYERAALSRCFEVVGERCFLNDDVVIPLALRRFNRGKIIRYLPDSVVVDGVPRTRSELVRRRRLVSGNIEVFDVPGRGRGGTVVEMLLARRICRLLWVYWLAAVMVGLGVGVVTSFGGDGIFVILGLVTVGTGLLRAPVLGAAACASFEALPRLLGRCLGGSGGERRVAWR